METSEERKERLKAMRVEAEACDNGNGTTSSSAVPGYLSNPLAEDNAAVEEEPCAPCRFGYYTDPMAAFSSDTKRTKVADHSNTGASPMAGFPSHLSGIPRNPEMIPPPHQFQSNYSPDQRMHQQNFGPQRSPIVLARPFAMHHGNPPQVWNGAEGRFPGPRFRPPGSPGFRPPGSPGFRPPGSPGFGPPGTPGFGPPGSPGFGPPGSPGSGPPGSPAFGLPGSPGFVTNTWQGRGHRLSHSPSPHSVHGGSPGSSSGRGRGRPGSGWRGGRGRGSHGPPALDRQLGPEQFYNASMVEENPWKGLPPVSWKGVDAISYGGSNRPSYGSTNKASFSEGSNKSTPQPNLAEYLAASCNETINETPTS